ncbi:MAG: hypothetical protein AAFQ05_10585 [Pseudomonadota bacterium]
MTRDTHTHLNTSGHGRTLQIDWERYGAMLDASDLSEAQKLEFIQALWSIMTTFVDLGFGLHPVQQVCGQADLGSGDLSADLLSLDSTSAQSDFEAAASRDAGAPPESETDRRS